MCQKNRLDIVSTIIKFFIHPLKGKPYHIDDVDIADLEDKAQR